MLRYDLDDDDDDDGNAASPQMPHSQPQNNSDMKTPAGFKWAILPVIQVVTAVPMSVAIASEAPATKSAIAKEWKCMKAAMPVATAVTPGPSSNPAAALQALAFSRPFHRNVIQVSNVTARACRPQHEHIFLNRAVDVVGVRLMSDASIADAGCFTRTTSAVLAAVETAAAKMALSAVNS